MALASSLLRPALEPPPLLAQLVDEPALLYLGHRVAQRTPTLNDELSLASSRSEMKARSIPSMILRENRTVID